MRRESNNTTQKLLLGGGGGAHCEVWGGGVGVRAGSASVHTVIGLCRERERGDDNWNTKHGSVRMQ